MCNKEYRKKKIEAIKQVVNSATVYSDVDKLLGKIITDVYDCGYEDGMADEQANCDSDCDREPMYNEGYD